MQKELLTIQGLNSLSIVLNIRNLCSECGINYNTLKNKLYNSIPLPDSEAEKIEEYLKSKYHISHITLQAEYDCCENKSLLH